MEQVDLLEHTVQILEALAIPYMIVGSFASNSGNKIDFMIARSDASGRKQVARRALEPSLPHRKAYVARPEDVIIAKLLYYQEGGSEKHLRDIAGVLRIGGVGVDREYIENWASQLGVGDEWNAALARVS